MINKTALPTQVKRLLLQIVTTAAERGEAMLPSEEVLCEQLRISRTTLRSALVVLEKEGLIVRVHGRGTFINTRVLDVKPLLNVDQPYLWVIKQLGYEPSMAVLSFGQRSLPEEWADRLGAPGAEVICIERLFRANDEAAIYSTDYIPLSHLAETVDRMQPEESVLHFASRWCRRPIAYSTAVLVPALAPDGVWQLFGLDGPQPVLVLDHLHFDRANAPVGLSRAYTNDRLIRWGLVRNWYPGFMQEWVNG